MLEARAHEDPLLHAVQRQLPAGHRLRVGIDAVALADVAASRASFGRRFESRLFTPHEIAAANGSTERLASRFAAKEAAIKAFDLPEVGLDWRHIEVRSGDRRRPTLHLSGRALTAAKALGTTDVAVSLTHERGMAFAVVVAVVLAARPTGEEAPN